FKTKKSHHPNPGKRLKEKLMSYSLQKSKGIPTQATGSLSFHEKSVTENRYNFEKQLEKLKPTNVRRQKDKKNSLDLYEITEILANKENTLHRPIRNREGWSMDKPRGKDRKKIWKKT
ncbi:hypothetical protein HHI36_023459, partial [Cryptolaemus montrouzieri]